MLKNSVFESREFNKTVQKLQNLKGLSGKDTRSLVIFLKELDTQNQTYLVVKSRLIKEYEGTIGENGVATFTPENEVKIRQKLQELLQTEFIINSDPIMYFESLDLTIQDIVLLNGLIVTEG